MSGNRPVEAFALDKETGRGERQTVVNGLDSAPGCHVAWAVWRLLFVFTVNKIPRLRVSKLRSLAFRERVSHKNMRIQLEFNATTPRNSDAIEAREVPSQTKVAIIASRNEHCSRTRQIRISTFSIQEFKRSLCSDVKATLESFPTNAHHSER